MSSISHGLRNRVPYVLVVLGALWAYHVRTDDLSKQARRNAQIATTAATAADAAKHAAMVACDAQVNDWEAFQRVIATTRNPPSLLGKPISSAMRSALDAYSDALATDVGPKPKC